MEIKGASLTPLILLFICIDGVAAGKKNLLEFKNFQWPYHTINKQATYSELNVKAQS